MPALRLPEWLYRDGLLSRERASELGALHDAARGQIWERIVGAGWLTDRQVGEAIARRFDVSFRRIAPEDVEPALLASAPPEVWQRTLTAPLALDGPALVVACTDPVDRAAFDELSALTKRAISPVVTPPADIRAAVAASLPPVPRAMPEPRRWRVFRTEEPARTLVEIRFDDRTSGPTGHVELLGSPDAVALVELYLADPFGQRPLLDPGAGYRYGPFFYDPWDVHETLQTLVRNVENMALEVVEG